MKDYYISWEGDEMPKEVMDARNKALASFRQTYHGVDGDISGSSSYNLSNLFSGVLLNLS